MNDSSPTSALPLSDRGFENLFRMRVWKSWNPRSLVWIFSLGILLQQFWVHLAIPQIAYLTVYSALFFPLLLTLYALDPHILIITSLNARVVRLSIPGWPGDPSLAMTPAHPQTIITTLRRPLLYLIMAEMAISIIVEWFIYDGKTLAMQIGAFGITGRFLLLLLMIYPLATSYVVAGILGGGLLRQFLTVVGLSLPMLITMYWSDSRVFDHVQASIGLPTGAAGGPYYLACCLWVLLIPVYQTLGLLAWNYRTSATHRH